MKLLKIYALKLIAILLGIIAGVLYLCNISINIVATILCIAGIIIYIDTKIHTDNVYQTNINFMKENMNKKNNTIKNDNKKGDNNEEK